MQVLASDDASSEGLSKGAVAPWLHACGVCVAVLIGLQTLISPFLAAAQPIGEVGSRFFRGIAATEAWLPRLLRDGLEGEGALAADFTYVLGTYVPIIVQLAFCGVLAIVSIRRSSQLSDRDTEVALKWAFAFIVLSTPAFSVLTQDVWVSVAWGRMVEQGMNPFSIPYPESFAADIPLDYPPAAMSYGPLWALICGGLALLFGASPVAMFLGIKVVLGLSWAVCLDTVFRILKRASPLARMTGVLIVGWLPSCVYEGVAEGHIDVTMMAFTLLWLRFASSSSKLVPLALVASILTKYVTAPLLLVDVLLHWRTIRTDPRAYAARVFPAAAVLASVGVFLLLSRDGAQATASHLKWSALSPGEPLRLIGSLIGIPVPKIVPYVVVKLGCIALVAPQLLALVRSPTEENLRRAALAVMVGVMFLAHVWPWYFLWVLPVAAVVQTYGLAWFVVGAGVVAPLTIVHWWRFDLESSAVLSSYVPAAVMYLVGWLTWRRAARRGLSLPPRPLPTA